MKKVLFAIIGLTLLFFPFNGFAYDCDNECVGLNPLSKWCKCVTECNSNNTLCVSGFEDDCIFGWANAAYFEFSECMKDMQPFDSLWCNSGNTCPQAVCKGWMQYYGWDVGYKNIGQCIKDQAVKYGYVDDFWGEDEYYWCNGEDVTWVEACECVKASGCDANNVPE